MSLFAVTTLTFAIIKYIPGDPFTQEEAIPNEIINNLRSYYGLDKPIYVQYWKYIKGILTYDLGPSLKYEELTVNEIIKNSFPISAKLGLLALAISVCWGTLCGSIAGFSSGKWPDSIAMIVAVIGMSVPSFIMATVLQYIFAFKLNILPLARTGSFNHLILPALALSAFPSAFIARLTRSSVIDVLNQEYILTSKAKGLSNIKIWKNHVLKNSFLPIISYLSMLFTNIIMGSFVIEKIFGIHGLGYHLVSSIINRDYTVIMGITLFYSTLLMTVMFVADILYCVMDPRIKYNMAFGE